MRFKAIRGKPWIRASRIPSPGFSPAEGWFRAWYRPVMDVDHLPYVEGLSMPVLWFYRDDDDTFPSFEAAEVVENIKRRHNKDFKVVVLAETGHVMRKAPTPDAAFPFRMVNKDYLEIMDGWIRKNVTRTKALE